MSKIITTEIAKNCIHNGLISSRDDYIDWSGGLGLWQAPEYLITINITREFSKNGFKNFVVLEKSAIDAFRESRTKNTGRIASDWRPYGRVDIMLYNCEKPIVPIEVKRFVSTYSSIGSDMKRITKFVTRSHGESSIKFGAIAFYIGSDDKNPERAQNRVKSRLDNIEREAKFNLPKGLTVKLMAGEIKQVDGGAWSAAALIVEPNEQN